MACCVEAREPLLVRMGVFVCREAVFLVYWGKRIPLVALGQVGLILNGGLRLAEYDYVGGSDNLLHFYVEAGV